jgi:murein DD-endopeptidase MepM/ murein hydrolase activator NlpD
LGLGGVRAVGRLIFQPPKREWVQAAGQPTHEPLLWPVENARLYRGLQPAEPGKRRHKGLDIAAPEGAPIRAIKSGIVAYSDNAIPGYGNLLVTVHPDGSVAFYGHCRAIYVFAGQRIQRGQIVGEVGKTGRATGPHVHFEYRTAGKIRNPLPQFGDQVPNRPRRSRRPNV